MALALQAEKMGLACHPMGGFREEKAYEVCGLDAEKYQAMCVIAVGKRGRKEELSSDFQNAEAPSDRKALETFIHRL